MLTDYFKAEIALRTHLFAIPNLPTVSTENKDFDPDTAELWLDVDNQAGESFGLDLLGDHDMTPGVFQITIYAPKNTGVGLVNQWLTTIKNHFKPAL